MRHYSISRSQILGCEPAVTKSLPLFLSLSKPRLIVMISNPECIEKESANTQESGATGLSLGEHVREAYSFLCNNYAPGDEIFLIGFSRGAFTARSVAGLISAIGLLTKKGLPFLPEIYRDVQFRRSPHYQPRNSDIPFPNKPSANDPRYAEELYRVSVAIRY